MAYDNANKGVLFKNDKDKDSQPDYKGSINVAGFEYWISGWIKVAGPNAQNPGSKFLSVSVEAKDAKFLKPKPTPSADLFDDQDIPF